MLSCSSRAPSLRFDRVAMYRQSRTAGMASWDRDWDRSGDRLGQGVCMPPMYSVTAAASESMFSTLTKSLADALRTVTQSVMMSSAAPLP